MKTTKLILKGAIDLLSLLALSGAGPATSASAQGTVLFQNDERGLVYQWSGLTNATLTLSGYDNKPHTQIAYAPPGTACSPWVFAPGGVNSTTAWLSANPGWVLGPIANSVAPGRFDGGTISLNGIAPGAQAQYVIFAWSLGTNFDYAANMGVWCGFAGPFTTGTGGGGQPAVSLAATFTGITNVGSAVASVSIPASARTGNASQPHDRTSAGTALHAGTHRPLDRLPSCASPQDKALRARPGIPAAENPPHGQQGPTCATPRPR